MPPETPPREQEQSIKARKTELFEAKKQDVVKRKKFPQYLADTPPAPLTRYEKVAVWGTAALVVILLIATIATIPPPPKKIIKYIPASPDAVKAATEKAQGTTPEKAKSATPEKAKPATPEKAKPEAARK